MAKEFASPIHKLVRRVGAILILAAAVLVSSLSAQQQGPLPAPPPASPTAQPTPSPQPSAASSPAPAAKPQSESGTISHEPPALPVEQIIQKFGEREMEFKKERDNYTYYQSF